MLRNELDHDPMTVGSTDLQLGHPEKCNSLPYVWFSFHPLVLAVPLSCTFLDIVKELFIFNLA